jgi:hypothetical protein
MPRFLIEVPHPEETVACAKVVQVFLNTGSHFLTHADWGCEDGVHSAWFTVDAESKEDARLVVPPPFRAEARITLLCKFTSQEIDDILARHGQQP